MKQGTGVRKKGVRIPKHIVSRCKWCDEEFEQVVLNGRPTVFCCDECKRLHYNQKRRVSRGSPKSPYFSTYNVKKKNTNKLDLLLEDLNEKGITYSEYKKALALSKVEGVDVNV